jgi:hypothetical protein
MQNLQKRNPPQAGTLTVCEPGQGRSPAYSRLFRMSSLMVRVLKASEGQSPQGLRGSLGRGAAKSAHLQAGNDPRSIGICREGA